MSKCKNQDLGKTTIMLCIGLIFSTTSLTAVDKDDFEISKTVKFNAFDTKEERAEKEKIINQQKLYEKTAQENYQAAQKFLKTCQMEAKKGSSATFDQETNKRHRLAIEADSQEKAREATEKADRDEKAYDLEYEHRLKSAN